MRWIQNQQSQHSMIYSGQNNMQSIHLTIEQFLSYISAPHDFEHAPREVENFFPYPIEERDVMLVWQDDSAWSRRRPMIVVKDSYLREFVAFVSTYIKTHTPFSAFFRIIEESKFRELYESLDLSSNGRHVPHELVGVVIAEAFAQSGERATNISSLQIQACFATLSSSLLACFSAGYGPASIDEMIDKWGQAKRNFSDDTLALPIPCISSFWRIVFAVCVDPSPISENLLPPTARQAIESFLRRRELTAQDWHLLCHGNSQLESLAEILLGSKEERIAGLDRTVAILQHSTSLTQGMQEILVGAAASFVANGAMSYLPLTKAFHESHPAATLWFAFFTSFNRRSDVFDSGESLGRHLESKIFVRRNLFDNPTADIDFNELQVVGPSSRGMRFRTQQTSSVTVEIIPMVQGRFRMGRGSKPSEVTPPASPISLERWEELKFLTDRISRIVLGQSERLWGGVEVSSHQKDSGTKGSERALIQSEFFETKPKGSRRSASPKKTK